MISPAHPFYKHNRGVGPDLGDKAVKESADWFMTVSAVRHVAHTRVRLLTPRRLLYHIEPIVLQPWALPFSASPVHPRPREDSPILGWLMLNDRQTVIKAAPGSPPVTVQRGQRGDDKWRDRSSMPDLELGQESRIRQHGWTLLASSETMHSPQWTFNMARLSHLFL